MLDYKTKKEQVARFINPELCKITENLVFTEPYRESDTNSYHKEIEPQVLAIQADELLRNQVALLKEIFMTHAQALIHGDFHTGSLMVNQAETYAIDPEFAFYGPMGFDIGAVISNLLLSYASHEVRTANLNKRIEFRRYLTNAIIQLWKVFESEFQKIWMQVDAINMPRGYQEEYMLRILRDAAGMAACEIMRRVIGLAGVEDIRGIESIEDRSIAASLALNIATAIIKQWQELRDIEEIVEIVTATQSSYTGKKVPS